MPKITRTQGPTVAGEEMTPEARAMRERAERDQEASEESELARLNSDEAGRGEGERQGRVAKADAANETTKREHELEEVVEDDRTDSDDDGSDDEQKEGAESSRGSSTSRSSAKQDSLPKRNAARNPSLAPTTESRSGAGRTGNSSASSTGGASTGKGK